MGGELVRPEQEEEEQPLRRQSGRVPGCMPLAPKSPPYLQLRQVQLLLAPRPPGRPLPGPEGGL